jgi:hypothetical protein
MRKIQNIYVKYSKYIEKFVVDKIIYIQKINFFILFFHSILRGSTMLDFIAAFDVRFDRIF